MTIAVVGAVAIGYWEEAAIVAFLFGVSETLETYTMEKARQSIKHLMDISPKQALIRRRGLEQTLSVEDIRIGDVMIVKPGGKIAMDGEIVKGTSSINQAAITGESIPKTKTSGEEVFAGSLNVEGSIEVKVTKLVQDTTLSKIITMVEEAQEQKAPSQAFVDKFARYYTPTVIILAVGIALVPPLFLNALWQRSIYNALALLLVACPCSLVVSTPVALISAISNAARRGVLVKGGLHLENAGSLKAIAFDKTGTLTSGEPFVTDIIPLKNHDIKNILSLAAGMEKLSEHPLGTAIVNKAKESQAPPFIVDEFKSHAGKGIEAIIRGDRYFIGSPHFFAEDLKIPLSYIDNKLEDLYKEGKTTILLGHNKQVLAILALSDKVRESSLRALKELKSIGIEKTIMLTGDNHAAAKAIAEKIGIDEFFSQLLPEDKVAAIKKIKEKYISIAMVGDGINDAPALATATTGIAMGGAGTDTALETADIVLMADDLSKLPFTINLSRASLRVIKQNIAFSIGIKALATALVFPGLLTLWLAIVADMGATLLVTLNGIRLLKIKPK